MREVTGRRNRPVGETEYQQTEFIGKQISSEYEREKILI